METAKKLMIIVGIAAIANARYKGKSYVIGDEIPVAYEDIDSLVSQGILDKDDAAECKAAAEEEARQYAEKADEAIQQARAEAEANEKLKKAHDELLEEHAQLKAELKARITEIAQLANQNTDLHAVISNRDLEIKSLSDSLRAELEAMKAAQATIKQLQADKAALEKAATKAKK